MATPTPANRKSRFLISMTDLLFEEQIILTHATDKKMARPEKPDAPGSNIAGLGGRDGCHSPCVLRVMLKKTVWPLGSEVAGKVTLPLAELPRTGGPTFIRLLMPPSSRM